MIYESELLTTVRSRLLAIGELPEDSWLFENVDRTNLVADRIYVEEQFVPFGENAVGSGVDRLIADVRYYVLIPRGQGSSAGRKIATQIKQLFPIGSSIVGEMNVVIDQASVMPGRVRDETRYAIPVSIIVRAEALRQN